MPFVVTTRTNFSLGAIIALLVIVVCLGCWMWGGATLAIVLGLIAALAIAILIG